jgi:GNAT superfamily N-acetyltransferase
MAERITLAHLREVQWVIPILAKWFEEEWSPWYGARGAGDAVADLNSWRNIDKLPLAVVAFDVGESPVGIAALKSAGLGSELGIGPWLSTLLVSKPYRRQGVGSLLIERIEQDAHRLGFSALFAATDAASSLLTRRAWTLTPITLDSLRQRPETIAPNGRVLA